MHHRRKPQAETSTPSFGGASRAGPIRQGPGTRRIRCMRSVGFFLAAASFGHEWVPRRSSKERPENQRPT
eukprot:119296-Pyramimonas_sp.AAC.1